MTAARGALVASLVFFVTLRETRSCSHWYRRWWRFCAGWGFVNFVNQENFVK
jgi:hypothetical protein